MILAFGAAIAGAVAYGVGSVLQAVAARRATGTAVLRHPSYLLGVGCDMLAFVASVVAVRDLPLFAVQSVLAGSLGVTVVLARVVLGTPVRRRDGAAVIGIVGALVVVALASGKQSAQPPPTWFTAPVLLAMAGATVLLVNYYRRSVPTRLALLAGACFAGSAIGARALDLNGTWFAVLSEPMAWAIVGFGLIGSLAYARSLEHGSPGASTATVWVVEVALAGLVGIAVLHDHVLPGWGWPALGGLSLAILGCVLLSGAQPTPLETVASTAPARERAMT